MQILKKEKLCPHPEPFIHPKIGKNISDIFAEKGRNSPPVHTPKKKTEEKGGKKEGGRWKTSFIFQRGI